jgi:AcrR family transcriptional regulator
MNCLEGNPVAGAKAERIIAAARDLFLEQGYDAISMDEVARRAGVAKQTVYAYNACKDTLFLAVVEGERRRANFALPAEALTGEMPIGDALRRIGLHLLEVLLSPSLLSLFRVALAAAHRFPKLGRSIYETGAQEMHADLARLIGCAATAGNLVVEDATMAAQQFIALINGELHIHCLLDPGFRPSTAQIDRQVDAAVDCFMARYGCRI